jgi:Holliday junction resolvasome RuvABC DNA-binding subunit
VGAEGEAFSALVALGYKPAEATRLIKAATAADTAGAAGPSGASSPAGTSTEDLIRRALQGALR